MPKTRVAIYCRANDSSNSKIQRMVLDRLFFRAAAYAHSHNLLIVSYYEDSGYPNINNLPGLSNMLADYRKMIFDAVLVSNSSQLPDIIAQKKPFTLLSVDPSERRINYL